MRQPQARLRSRQLYAAVRDFDNALAVKVANGFLKDFLAHLKAQLDVLSVALVAKVTATAILSQIFEQHSSEIKRLAAAVEIGSHPEIEIKIEDLEAPVAKGQVIGRARLICNGQEVDACDLIAARDVPLWSFKAAMRSVIRSWSLPFA